MNVMDVVQFILKPFSDLTDRFYWQYDLMSVLMGFVMIYFTGRPKGGLIGTLKTLFPAWIYQSPSFRTDVLFFWLTVWLQWLYFDDLYVIWTLNVDMGLRDLLQIESGQRLFSPEFSLESGVNTLMIALAVDFGMYLAHLAQHRIQLLWRFHEVHHTTEALNPLSVYRQHPVDIALNTGVVALTLGGTLAILNLLEGHPIQSLNINGVSILLLLFYLLGFHIRHSHIWISYSPSVSHWLISPAQHQIHHSIAERHIDKNLGFMFAIWDHLFGTLYVPTRRETLRFGVKGRTVSTHGFFNLLFDPFKTHSLKLKSGSWVLAGTAIIAMFIVVHHRNDNKITPVAQDSISLLISEMTSLEVSQLLEEGFKTVIVPTAGIEANGNHMILGKHGYIVREAADRTARRVGKTLVAPLIDYVPEGNINPPEGHMRYPGTLSLRRETFKAILEDVARSLKQHGFTHIVLMGDSGGNITPQIEVAAQLSDEWASEGIIVQALRDYYLANRQVETLSTYGFSNQSIGRHAGIRDTSELMAVNPNGLKLTVNDSQASNGDGDNAKASPEIGNLMINLKVAAAVREIRGHAFERKKIEPVVISDGSSK